MIGQQRYYSKLGVILLCFFIAVLAACQNVQQKQTNASVDSSSQNIPVQNVPVHNSSAPIILSQISSECQEPRPEMCIQVYEPVCALKDTGLHCVKAPCDGVTEWVTFSNACHACGDKSVRGFRDGEC